MSVVALDGMGGDLAPSATAEGAVRAARRGIEVALVGDRAVLERELEHAGGASGVRIVHAPDNIGMGDHSARETLHRRESSIFVGIELVKRGEAGAFVSMGNTGAVLAVAFFVLGRLQGVDRPALAASLPVTTGRSVLLDVGANADARAAHLVDFARLGTAYAVHVLGIAEPGVALLNIGEEPTKGSALTIEAHQALAALDARGELRFTGNAESRDLLRGAGDVVVTDGFTGNIALKLMEGSASVVFGELRRAARRSPAAAVGGLLLRRSVRALQEPFDYRHHGGAPLLGVNGIVMVGHGRSDGSAVESALVSAAAAADSDVMEALGQAFAPSAG